jgi:hypothetical protein
MGAIHSRAGSQPLQPHSDVASIPFWEACQVIVLAILLLPNLLLLLCVLDVVVILIRQE